MFIYLFAYLFLYEASAAINVLEKGVMPLEKESVAIQFYIDVENDDRKDSCTVTPLPKRCCLTDLDKEDCDTMDVYSGKTILVKPKDRETLVLVYPSIYQHDQIGFCDFGLLYRCGRSKTTREIINIPFDTRTTFAASRLLVNYIADQKQTDCGYLDEDSLKDCEPVDCSAKYFDRKPFYDGNLHKCIPAVTCAGDPNKQMPDIVYEPNSNTCRDLENTLTVQDIYEINTGLFTTIRPRPQEEMFVKVKSNCSTPSQNFNLLKDIMFGKLSPVARTDVTDYSECCKAALLKILACILGITALILSCAFCISTTTWLFSKWRDGSLNDHWQGLINIKERRKKGDCKPCRSRVNQEVRNSLLREVIVRDIPMELRDSVVDICGRMEKEVRWKKRYRREDMGSQISLQSGESSSSSGTSAESANDQTKLLN